MIRLVHRPRDAFSMVEIAFSLGIIVVAIVTVMLMVAGVQRSVQRSRIGLYAAVAATNLMEGFHQNEEDFRSAQDANTPFVRGMVYNKDQVVQSTNQDAGRLLSGQGHDFATAGMFDWEIRALADKTIIPVPSEIARRLDSPGDEIGRVLDAGGRLYYLDPTGTNGQGTGANQKAGRANAAREMVRMVFAVVGSAQQNTLINHPMIPLQRELYPFPPQGYLTNGAENGPPGWGNLLFIRSWGRNEVPGTPFTWNAASKSVVGGDLRSMHRSRIATDGNIEHWLDGYGNVKLGTLDERSTWEEQAYIDELTGISVASSPWRAGLPEFLRLDNYHWQRIHHQLECFSYRKGSATVTKQDPIYADVPVTITERQITYDRLRNPIETTVTRTVIEKQVVGFNTITEPANSNFVYLRGMPTPPVGLGTMQGGRGTDILNEDAESLALDRWNQLRIGLPSLERRVMYRTAALALWGKVDGHGSITEVALDQLGTPGLTGNPNVIAPGALPLARNPLLTVIPPPKGTQIHPAQVFALSHLAHAAIMVTGYKPPFVDERNSVDPSEHVNLVPPALENEPYKEPEAGRFFLYHPFHGGADETAAKAALRVTAEDIASKPLFDASSGTAPSYAVSITNPLDERIARYMNGQPITYKRYLPSAPVLNPFPAPYADRGAFTWFGSQVYTRNPDTLRITSHGSLGGALNDTEMARIALENCLAWTMAYVRENPYCQIVPKPLNGPTFNDRPLFAYDLFNGAGTAFRPPTPTSWNNSRVYDVLWGSDRARWPAMYTGVARINSFELWNNSKYYANGGAAGSVINPVRSQTNGAGSTANVYLDPLVLGGLSNLSLQNTHNRSYRFSLQSYRSDLNGWNNYPTDTYNRAHTAADANQLRMPVSPQRNRWWYDQKFNVADRTRQLVFWAVDWQSYEDAESQPSEPMDVSFYYFDTSTGASLGGAGPGPANPLRRKNHAEQHLMWANPARDATHLNPPTSDVKYLRARSTDGNNYRYVDQRTNHLLSGINFTSIMYDTNDPLPWARLGTWGADRNANGLWDRGRIPANSRMVAVEVARFPFYDPVMWTTIGN